jgi:hypothetical protein
LVETIYKLFLSAFVCNGLKSTAGNQPSRWDFLNYFIGDNFVVLYELQPILNGFFILFLVVKVLSGVAAFKINRKLEMRLFSLIKIVSSN